MNYVINGIDKAISYGDEEDLTKGTCKYCPKSSSRSIINIGTNEWYYSMLYQSNDWNVLLIKGNKRKMTMSKY